MLWNGHRGLIYIVTAHSARRGRDVVYSSKGRGKGVGEGAGPLDSGPLPSFVSSN
jgi:hypothetical protein